MTRLVFLALFFVSAPLLGADIIEKIEIVGNEKTVREAILRISELEEGQEFTSAMLTEAKNLIASSGVFERVKISSRNGSDSNHRIVTIEVVEKTTWFIVPSFSYSQTGFSGGGVFGEANLFGRLKKAALFADWGPGIRRVAGGYRDPEVFGSRLTISIDGIFRIDDMAEYEGRHESKKVRVKEYGGTFMPGVRWTEHVTTSIGIYYRRIRERDLYVNTQLSRSNPVDDFGTDIAAVVEFDFRNSKYFDGLMEGTEVKLNTQFSDDRYFSDYDYTKQLIYLTHGITFWNRRANSVSRASFQLGKDLPYYSQLTSGGQNLRGYLHRQFRGDTKYAFNQEFMFPVYDFKRFILRAVTFWDNTVIYRKSEKNAEGNAFERNKWHNGVGLGIRFYLKGVAIPLFGFDFARGIEDAAFSYYINVGGVF